MNQNARKIYAMMKFEKYLRDQGFSDYMIKKYLYIGLAFMEYYFAKKVMKHDGETKTRRHRNRRRAIN